MCYFQTHIYEKAVWTLFDPIFLGKFMTEKLEEYHNGNHWKIKLWTRHCAKTSCLSPHLIPTSPWNSLKIPHKDKVCWEVRLLLKVTQPGDSEAGTSNHCISSLTPQSNCELLLWTVSGFMYTHTHTHSYTHTHTLSNIHIQHTSTKYMESVV